MSEDIVNDCVEDLIKKLKATSAIDDQALYVYSEKVFMDASKPLTPPCAAVIYQGAVGSDAKIGFGGAAKVRFAILLLAGEHELDVKGHEEKDRTTALLNEMRKAIKGQCSPSGHPYTFEMEAPYDIDDVGLVYIQRWATQAIL